METRIDENGNEIVVVTPGKSAKIKTGTKTVKKNDAAIADEAMEQWNRPLAFQAGNFWSYTSNEGWSVCTDQLQVLCNELRGTNTENSVMKIIAAKCRVPDLGLVPESATYWEYCSGEWRPFPVSHSQVLFSNGILDLATMEFTPTNSRIVYGPRVSIPFEENLFTVTDDFFTTLVEHAIPDKDQRNYLQKLCGLILQPHTIFRGQIVFYGVPHSGKSTLATAIATAPAGVLGQTAVSESRLVQDKWAVTMLVNKFANVSHDSEFTAKWEAFMKQYTTGTMVVEPKFGKPVTVAATAKLLSTCNEFQIMRDASGAAEQRYKVFRFDNPIAESNEISQTRYMMPSYWAEPDRRKAVIAWMLNGLEAAIEEGIEEPTSMKSAKRQAFFEGNSLLEFVSTSLVEEEGAFLTSEEILQVLGESAYGNAAKALPKLINRVWGKSKIRINGKRGYPGLKIAE